MSETNDSPAPAVIFHEKLWPAWWIWLLVVGTGLAAVAALYPVNAGISIAAGIVVMLVVALLVLVSTPAITLTARTLRVGRASIEREFIGEVGAYRGEEATFQRGPGLNATAFMCLRGWIDPVVRIEITDERDATPYWLASTRRPEELQRALQSTHA
jgi:hypothetical protein